ncbi:MAG TPA: hypothetical protein VMW24_17395 [Sedimentisphaerales bacterium]|nr:hypothetical protein [Sedimentisphaerales bacterium]
MQELGKINGMRELGTIAWRVTFLSLLVVATAGAQQDNWYTNSFYLLHEDHHTVATAAVGADADPLLTEQLVNLSRPDMIQIHAKGNPGWTTYPSKIGHVPPKLARDVLGLWRDIARRNGYHFSIYYNIGRDGEIMRRQPQWNRSKHDGSEWERALCYHSGVAESYIWPMLKEIMAGYDPDGFWLDGSVFTISLCYCPSCRERFKRQTDMELPENESEPGWSQFHEMQRQIYREFINNTCKLIHSTDPDCLVSFNWAYSVRMPEKPDPGIAYLTGDIANRVEGLSLEAHWYDGVGIPFDLMTTGYAFEQPDGMPMRKVPKARPQMEQEMAIVVANGGRFNLWDNPSATSGLDPNMHQFYSKIVQPFLRSRQRWCLGSKRLADVSLFHGAAAHYALAESTVRSFNKANNRIDGAAAILPRLHLNYEMVGDWRLHVQDVCSPLLLVEHPKKLTDKDIDGIIQLIKAGGNVLVTGMGVQQDRRLLSVFGIAKVGHSQSPENLTSTINGRDYPFRHYLYKVTTGMAETLLTVTDAGGEVWPLLTANSYGEGTAYYVAIPLLSAHGEQTPPLEMVRDVMTAMVPPEKRLVTTEAPDHVEVVLRQKNSQYILHEVNMAKGQRTYSPQRPGAYRPVTIHSFAPVKPHKTSIRVPSRPKRITMQPGDTEIKNWGYVEGRVELVVPAFDVHQMVVVQL